MASSVADFTANLKEKVIQFYNNTIGKYIASLFGKPASILFLGIDNAGKTTLVNKLKNNTNHIFMPTKHSTADTIEIGNLKARIIDIGGHRAARIAWKDYFYNVDGIVFLVDVADDARYSEVAESWKTILDLEREAPILVLMNKIDMLGYTSQSAEMDTAFKQEIQTRTGIDHFRNPKQQVKISYISVIREDVFKDSTPLRQGFAWLSGIINAKPKN